MRGGCVFERKAHPDMYDAILRRAAGEEIVFRNGQKVLTAEDAAQLVAENLGVAFTSMTGALGIADRGAIVRPLEDKELLAVYLVSRADNRSKLVSEFVRLDHATHRAGRKASATSPRRKWPGYGPLDHKRLSKL